MLIVVIFLSMFGTPAVACEQACRREQKKKFGEQSETVRRARSSRRAKRSFAFWRANSFAGLVSSNAETPRKMAGEKGVF